VARKCKRDEEEVTRRQEEEAVVSALEVELRALLVIDRGMSLLDAMEYTTSDPAHRISLYRRCAEDRIVHDMGQDDHRLFGIASSVALDLALLERRAAAKGFQI
jgi:hypothetical protein